MAQPKGSHVLGAKVVHLIEVKSTAGAGTDDDPARFIVQWFDFQGDKVAEFDPLSERKPS